MLRWSVTVGIRSSGNLSDPFPKHSELIAPKKSSAIVLRLPLSHPHLILQWTIEKIRDIEGLVLRAFKMESVAVREYRHFCERNNISSSIISSEFISELAFCCFKARNKEINCVWLVFTDGRCSAICRTLLLMYRGLLCVGYFSLDKL
ncbi:hypothetical protein NPIL_635431 [Nephila pilipes]|uniref:Uncharacterized protein n=1 Tax=Nephila pilipes TaxID=299642 RepID=A0A8X6P9Y8_NEPPI|nr:hypothetical protein NPIL_635431 [Nephila pilipes]